MENNTLQHHGVKGQKWGVRRTQEQLDRAAGIVNEAQKIDQRLSASKMTKKTRKMRKALASMTDEELRQRVDRLGLEQRYMQLSSEKIAKGKNFLQRTLEAAGTTLAVGSSAVTIAVAIKKLKDEFGG